MKAVFDTLEKSDYQDSLPNHYHFPAKYLENVENSVGDWVVFRTPRAGGGDKAYFAISRLDKIEQHPGQSGYFARLDRFLTFPQKVSWRENGVYREEKLRNLPDIKTVGRSIHGASVRNISDEDFSAIIKAGLHEALGEIGLSVTYLDVEEEAHKPIEDFHRRIDAVVQNKKVREASFRYSVLEAYGNRCAVTGIRLVDENGKAEAQAAHLWSVEHGGPDVVQNGIAVSGTAHWLLDRGWIDITDKLGLSIKRKGIQKELLSLIAPQRSRILLPSDKRLWPHTFYLAKRREGLSKQNAAG
jgi:putative restriction endonuclease